MTLPLPKIADKLNENQESAGFNLFKISQEKYIGPFDVFLAQIDSKELSVNDFSITDIISAYLSFMRENKIEFNVSGDFLFMAAFLIELKSKTLLPPDPSDLAEENELLEIEDDLLKHLEEYKKFKKISEHLRARKDYFSRVIPRYMAASGVSDLDKRIVLSDVSLRDLVVAFQKIWEEVSAEENIQEIQVETVSVEDRIKEINDMISRSSQPIEFSSIFIRRTKIEVVVTFLAILEMAKQTMIKIVQESHFGSIFIAGVEGEVQNGI